MKTLYLDCCTGAAGDMLAAALSELLPDPEKFIREFNAAGIPNVSLRREASSGRGVTGSRILPSVRGRAEGGDPAALYDGGYASGCDCLRDAERLVKDVLRLPEKIKEDILAVYRLIAEAESRPCSCPGPETVLYEAGMPDTFACVAAVCILMDNLSPEQVIVSPVCTGRGQVVRSCGVLPVPTPATAYLLKNIPIYSGNAEGELCDTAGAALLKYFADRFGDMPVMRTQAIGYGMGKSGPGAAGCVRAFWGETEDQDGAIVELCCNVDDMTAEAIGFALETFFAAGALEAYTIPVGMKKSRPGSLICVMCRQPDRDAMVELIFRHTTTLGIREQVSRRYSLSRRIEIVDSPFGPVRRKLSQGYGVERQKYEYEDVAAIARREEISISDVLSQL